MVCVSVAELMSVFAFCTPHFDIHRGSFESINTSITATGRDVVTVSFIWMLICFCELGRFRLWFFLRKGCFVCGSCLVIWLFFSVFVSWVDLGFGFSFGGGVLCVGAVSLTWM